MYIKVRTLFYRLRHAVWRRTTLDSVHTWTVFQYGKGGSMSRALSSALLRSETSRRYIPLTILRLAALMAASSGNLNRAQLGFAAARYRSRGRGELDSAHEAHVLWLMEDWPRLRFLLLQMCEPEWITTRQAVGLSDWAFWHLDHGLWSDFLEWKTASMNRLAGADFYAGDDRFLPQHITNLGHLALLCFRAARLKHKEPNVRLWLPREPWPNAAYVNQLVEAFPQVGVTGRTFPHELSPFGNYESLLVGWDRGIGWRPQPGASCFLDGDLVELDCLSREPLESASLPEAQRRLLFDLGLLSKWFIVIHVREAGRFPAQMRDSNVSKLVHLCEVVEAMGGQVVRMGDPSFPPFKAPGCLDYAHADFRDPGLDMWLWSNCACWVGNSSGASALMQTFRPPRVLFDIWPWDTVGRPQDLWLPTLLLDERTGKALPPEAVVKHPLSRAMNPVHFDRSRMAPMQHSPSAISDAVQQILVRSESVLPDIHNERTMQSGIQGRVARALRTSGTNRWMPLAEAAASTYTQLLDT